MAEIKIEKKKPIWPWILVGLLVLAGILFVVFANTDDDDFNDDERREQVRDTTYQNNEMRDRTTTGNTYSTERGTADNTAGTGDEVEQYIDHISDTSRMDQDHEYSNNALTYLIAAVENKARENNVDLEKDLNEMKNDVRQLTNNPQATNHADIIEEVGSKIANSLEKIQQQNYPNLSNEIDEVKEAADEISSSELALEQKNAINSFYQEAGEVLRKMS